MTRPDDVSLVRVELTAKQLDRTTSRSGSLVIAGNPYEHSLAAIGAHVTNLNIS